jgi:3-deoxy-manno-octulosonate cytidylyltransferase (CMP-KDO synthetase)
VHPPGAPIFSSQNPSLTIVAVIPARYASSRLPGKALAEIDGRPMIEHVYRRTAAARRVSRVIVAADDERIASVVRGFGGVVRMTKRTHQSGTDRIVEVIATIPCDIVVNVQGDEPLLEPAMIDELVDPFESDPTLQMTTLRRRIDDPADLASPSVTKVVVDREGCALYFSHAPIPHDRDVIGAVAYKHIGLYGYRRDFLLAWNQLEPTPLGRIERLEQLRALEHGIRIKAVETAYDSIGVDTEDDLERVRRLLTAGARG